MKKYSCLIVDDNEIERDAIEMHLRKINLLEIKAICTDGVTAAKVLMNEQVDIVFSDIDMPELSGLGLLRSINTPPVFVFITSFAEYAADGFDHDALDFIVKPATFERLLKATTKAIEYLDLKSLAIVNSNPTPLAENDDYFFIKETKGFTKLNYNDVIYIESMGDFSKIHTDKDRHITLVNLKNLERQLPSAFIRVHKQFIININQVATVTSYDISLNNGFVVPLSVVNRQELLERIASKTISRHTK
jgi:two-component system LytT family response regulator